MEEEEREGRRESGPGHPDSPEKWVGGRRRRRRRKSRSSSGGGLVLHGANQINRAW
jgi:hypothetical protein